MPKRTKRKNLTFSLTTPIVILGIFLIFISVFVLFKDIFIKEAKKKILAVPSTLTLDSAKKELFEIIDTEDPRSAFSRLALMMDKSSVVLKNCHGLVHELGHHSYQKYHDFGKAISYQDDICSSGYLHGVIEEYFENIPNVAEEMKVVCNKIPSKYYGKCHHAIGHGLMYYSDNDLYKSVRMCTAFPTRTSISQCLEGVYMENFLSDEAIHPSKFLNPDNPFFPCSEPQTIYKSICYFYSPMYFLKLHNDDYERAMRWCDSADPAFETICANGLGSRTMKQNIKDPKLVEKICMSGSSNLKDACIDGMVSYFLVEYGSKKKANELCNMLIDANKKNCLNSIKSHSDLIFTE